VSPKKQIQLSSLCLVGMLLIIFAYGLLFFYFPHILSYFVETGQELPIILKCVVMIGRILEKIQIVLIPALILGFLFVVIWRIQSSIKYRKHNTQIDSYN